MKFYRVQHNTIMSGLVVRYELLSTYQGQISASRDGVCIQGSWPIVSTIDDIKDMQDVLKRAFVQHNILKHSRDVSSFDFDPPCVVELHRSHFGADDEIIQTREYRGEMIGVIGESVVMDEPNGFDE